MMTDVGSAKFNDGGAEGRFEDNPMEAFVGADDTDEEKKEKGEDEYCRAGLGEGGEINLLLTLSLLSMLRLSYPVLMFLDGVVLSVNAVGDLDDPVFDPDEPLIPR